MSLRNAIISYMRRQSRSTGRGIPTWWFSRDPALYDYDTPTIRRELQRMEREGLVEADRRQSNNTLWMLTSRTQEL